MKRDLNLESWKVFAAVARTGSITETSAELEMDAPSISRIVSGLEKSLGGISLFDRSSLPLTLTDNGRFALEYATKMITLHDQLVTGLAANTDAMSGGAPGQRAARAPSGVPDAVFCLIRPPVPGDSA